MAAQSTPYRSIYALAFPAAGSFILNTLYGVNDFFWAGRLGSAAISAMGLCMMVVIFNAGLMALVQKGALASVARLRGLRNTRGLRRTIRQSLLLNVLLSLLVFACGWVLSPYLLSAMGGEGEVHRLAARYLRLIYLGYPAISTAMVLDGVFIGLGDTRTPFRLQIMGVSLNTALNAVSVLLLGAGITGIALASILSKTLTGALGAWIISRRLSGQLDGVVEERPDDSVAGSVRRAPRCRFPGWPEWRPAPAIWGEILRVGAPVCVSITFYSSIFMVLNRILARFGPAAFGVIGIGIRGVESIGFVVLLGFGAATSTMVGEALGRRVRELREAKILPGRPSAVDGRETAPHDSDLGIEEIRRLLQPVQRVALGAMYATYPVALLFSLAWWLIPEELCRLYTGDRELIALSADYLRMAAAANLFHVIEIVLGESLVGAGVSSWPLWVTVPGNLMRIPLALALVSWTSLGITGVWLAILISTVFKALGILAILRFLPWQRRALSAALKLERIN